MTAYLKDLAERVVASFAEGVLAALGMGVINVLDVDWGSALGIGAGAAVIALLKALAASKIGDPRSASMVPSLGVRTVDAGPARR